VPVEARHDAVGKRPLDHVQVRHPDVPDVAPGLRPLGLLAGRVAQQAVPRAAAVKAPGILLGGGGPVGAVLRVDHGEVDQFAARVLDPDVVKGHVLDHGGVPVVDAYGRAPLRVDDVYVLESHAVNRLVPRLEADLEPVAAGGHVPDHGVAHGDVVRVDVAQVLHHHAIVIRTDEDVLHQHVARRDDVDAVVPVLGARVQDPHAVDPGARRAGHVDRPRPVAVE